MIRYNYICSVHKSVPCGIDYYSLQLQQIVIMDIGMVLRNNFHY